MVLAPQIFSMFNFEIENDLCGGGFDPSFQPIHVEWR